MRAKVRKFANAMETKLRVNDYKQHWSYATRQYLFTRLSQECKELSRAVKVGSSEEILGEAGVPPARLYDLRHTFASSALANNVSLDVIGLMLGHRKRETTLRYAHLSADVGANAAAAAAATMGASI